MKIRIFRPLALACALPLVAAAFACGSPAADPARSTAQPVTRQLQCPQFEVGEWVDEGIDGAPLWECAWAMTLPTGNSGDSCPGPAVAPPSGMEDCTFGLTVAWPQSDPEYPPGATFWICPDTVEGRLPAGVSVGIGDVKTATRPLVSNCLGLPSAGYFFAYQWLPPLGSCTGSKCSGGHPEGSCTGGCVATGG
jgi:hypothetical protein